MIVVLLMAAAAIGILLLDPPEAVQPYLNQGRSMPTDQLGRHFSWAEVTRSSLGPVVPTDEQADNLRELVGEVLDPLRTFLARPVNVTSGLRSAAVNAAVGGSDSSDHMQGRAVDITVKGLSSEQLAALVLEAGVPYDQVIWYDASPHVHIGYRGARSRREVLRKSKAGGYVAQEPRPSSIWQGVS